MEELEGRLAVNTISANVNMYRMADRAPVGCGHYYISDVVPIQTQICKLIPCAIQLMNQRTTHNPPCKYSCCRPIDVRYQQRARQYANPVLQSTVGSISIDTGYLETDPLLVMWPSWLVGEKR